MKFLKVLQSFYRLTWDLFASLFAACLISDIKGQLRKVHSNQLKRGVSLFTIADSGILLSIYWFLTHACMLGQGQKLS